MSYNISSWHSLTNTLKIDRSKISEALAIVEDVEDSSLFVLRQFAFTLGDAVAVGADLIRCECSGNAYGDGAIEKLASMLHGTLEAVIVWEDGDSFTGIRIADGKVTTHEVVMSLGEEVAS